MSVDEYSAYLRVTLSAWMMYVSLMLMTKVANGIPKTMAIMETPKSEIDNRHPLHDPRS